MAMAQEGLPFESSFLNHPHFGLPFDVKELHFQLINLERT
jgi:hypothetical protein